MADSTLMNASPLETTSNRVQNQLRIFLIEQRWEQGARLVESELCSKFRVSRTPVREALFKLEQEGFVRSSPDRGFIVRKLRAHEVRELYPIVWTLEILAVQLSQERLINVLSELTSLNKQFAKANNNPPTKLYLDTKFHETLTSECRNKHLLQYLMNLRNLILRYEFAYMHEGIWCKESATQHDEIINAIARSNAQLIPKLVEANWRNGMERIAHWLDWKEWQEE